MVEKSIIPQHECFESFKFVFQDLKATDSKRLMELGHVAISRVQFLRSYMQNLNAQNHLQCVYLDETWIFENGSVHRSWQDDSYKSIKNGTLKGKGKLKYYFR
jgi:hypothetical protein